MKDGIIKSTKENMKGYFISVLISWLIVFIIFMVRKDTYSLVISLIAVPILLFIFMFVMIVLLEIGEHSDT